MAGASFDIKLEGEKELLAAMDKLISRAQNLKPVYADIGEMLLLSHQERWDKQQAPDGTPWEPLSAKYLASKRKRESKGSKKILVLDSMLRDLHYQSSHSGLQFGTDKVYGATHQFGDATRNIPARPFLGISGEDKMAILDILNEWLNTPL
jgi:phage virion morphogenesis protein